MVGRGRDAGHPHHRGRDRHPGRPRADHGGAGHRQRRDHRRGGERITLAIHGGFLQILRNEVTLLTDRAEIVEGDRAQAAELAQSLAEAAAAE